MPPNLRNVRLGQCDITYNGVNLGYSSGGVELTIKNDVQEIAIDEYGSAPIKAHHKGTRIEAKVRLAEYVYATLQKVINGSVLNEGNTTDSVSIGEKGGVALAGAPLTLHPSQVTGTAQDVQLFKAIATGDIKLDFKNDGETVYEVTFLALIDETKSNGALLAQLGIA